jgi:class 3 adenylate cyclase
LKVGVHVGTCLAVTLNGRLDYFGQAVNIAARVQALSNANEIYLTDEMLSVPGTEELLAAFEIEARSVELKGVKRRRAGSSSASEGWTHSSRYLITQSVDLS